MTLQTKHITVIKEISAVTLTGNLHYGDYGATGDEFSGWLVDDGNEKRPLSEWLEKFDGKYVSVTIEKVFPDDEEHLLKGMPSDE